MATKENDISENRNMTFCKTSIQGGAFSFSLALITLFGLPYLVIWRSSFSKIDFSFGLHHLVYILIIVAGLIVYEHIRGLTWSLLSPGGLKSMDYGMKWSYLNPFCYYKKPLKLRTYFIGLLMPSLLLGIVPLIVALINGSPLVFLFGVIIIYSAGGEYWLVAKLRNEPGDKIVKDHPAETGCYIDRYNKDLINDNKKFMRQE